uniref:peptidylprolyl isomerase n=1 Tax=Kalanchoe fedtschenkoi TaxID=63787 RepID=A0A7N0VET6_KALFE
MLHRHHVQQWLREDGECVSGPPDYKVSYLFFLCFNASRTVKLDSGVKFQDIIEGEGVEAHEGDIVEVNYVCRRSNGYFVYSTVDQFNGESRPVILPLDENQTIKGLKEVLVGMKAGGKRRALIPPSVGYVNENLKPVPDEFGPRRSLMSHASEPLVFEVQLLKVLRFQPLLTIN